MEAPFDWPGCPQCLPIGAPLGSSSINISKAPCSFSWTWSVCRSEVCGGLHSHGSTGNLFRGRAHSGTIWCSGTLFSWGPALSHPW